MNKIHRVLWNKNTQTFVAVAEVATSCGKGTARSTLCSAASGPLEVALQTLWAAMAAAGLCWGAAFAQALAPTQLPTGGQVSAGSARVSQSGSTMAITQDSQRAAINWQSFNVGSQAKVNITQPNSSSVLLNRILGNSASQIYGQINANGQVIMSNPSGVYFSPTATVDTASFTATTHGISDNDFMAGIMKYTRDGATGKIINEGSLSAGLGGYIALLAPEVRNSGLVVARLGTVVMAAGETFELEFDKQSRLTNILVSPSTLAALVENRQAVQAPGGLVILSAQAANQLQSGIVKNSGLVQATGLVDNGGVIRLSASQRVVNTGTLQANAAPNSSGQGGTITAIADLNNANSSVEIGGTLSAKGGDLGGHGGFIETSGAQVVIQDNTSVSTYAPKGKSGTWLIDPTNFTISAGAGGQTSSGIGASTLEAALTGGNVDISTNNTAGSDSGDLLVCASVAWSANTLSLSAYRNVNVTSALNGTGTSALNITSNVGSGGGVINIGANITTGGAQTYNNNVALTSANVSLTATSGGVSMLGGLSNTSSSNLTLTSATDSNIGGVISGGVKLIKAGTSNLTLESNNTYTGGTTVSGGALLVGTGSTAGSLGTGTVTNNASLVINRSNALNLSNNLGGTGSLTQAGPGTTSLTGANTYTGGTVLAGGTLAVVNTTGTSTAANNSLGSSGTLSFTGGTLQFSANNTLDYSSRLNTGASQQFAFDTNGQNVTLATLPANTGTFTKTGTGTLTVSNATTHFGNATQGATNISGGTLTLQVAHPSAVVSQAVINGTGTLNIEPIATNFTSAVNTSADLLFSTGGGSLGAFNLGRTGNTANITVNSTPNMAITGSQGYYGGNVTVANTADATFTSWSNGATLTLSGTTSVNILAPISVTNANSSIAIKTSQGTTAGSNVGYYGFGLSASGFQGRIDFSGASGQKFTTQDGSTGTLKDYTFITTLAELNASAAGGY
jgi:filamentous hemagglutinin family protein